MPAAALGVVHAVITDPVAVEIMPGEPDIYDYGWV